MYRRIPSTYGLLALSLMCVLATSVTAEIRQRSFGNDSGGEEFGPFLPQSIVLHVGNVVDAIEINDEHFGGGGGAEIGSGLFLDDGEYINKVKVCHGNVIDGVKFWTSEDRSYGKFGGGGGCQTIRGRVIRIEGRAGNKLDYLRIRYLKGYTPSTKVAGEVVDVVFDFVAPGLSRTVATTERARSLEAQRSLHKTSSSQTFSMSVEAEMDSKSIVGTGRVKSTVSESVTTADEREEETNSELESELTNEETVDLEPENGTVMVLKGRAQLWENSDGEIWMWPVGDPSWNTFAIGSSSENELPLAKSALRGSYDLSGGIADQVKLRAVDKKGYTILRKKK